jgi:VWFA-related protein
VQRAAEERDTVVYAIGVFADTDGAAAHAGRRELDRLTGRTGGLAFYPTDVDQVTSTALNLARQIRNQYTIGYTPLSPVLDGKYHTIRLEARGTEKLLVHTRPGYWAVAAGTAAPPFTRDQ